MSGLYSSGSGSGKLGFDSVGMIFRLYFFVSEIFKRNIHVMFCGVGGGMTVEVQICFVGSLLILSVSMPLSIGTLKIYVTDICRMDLKILSSQLKLLLLIFIQE